MGRGLRDAAEAGGAAERAPTASPTRRGTTRSSRSSRTSSAWRRCAAATRREAARRFEAAIELDPRNAPAHLNLGDVRLRAKATPPTRSRSGSGCVEAVARARLPGVLAAARTPTPRPARRTASRRSADKLIAANPQDWRARLALARHLGASGRRRRRSSCCSKRWSHNPHALALHQAIWETLSALQLPPALVGATWSSPATPIFYLDPHICLRCRYRSTELLWQCPHCHEWNTFVEERIAPAKDADDG